MSATTSNLLSNQWISYSSWMLFQQTVTAYFFFSFSPLDIFIFISITLSHFASLVTRFAILWSSIATTKLFHTFCVCSAIVERKNESNYQFFKRSLFGYSKDMPQALWWQNGYVRNVFICFIVMSYLAYSMKNFLNLVSSVYLYHSFLKGLDIDGACFILQRRLYFVTMPWPE